MKIRLSFCTALLLLTSATAQADSVGDQKGRSYKVIYNKHGAVLKSGKRRLYLGRNCSAYSKKFGKGKWEQLNGGFVINFRRRNFTFGHQELRFSEKCVLF